MSMENRRQIAVSRSDAAWGGAGETLQLQSARGSRTLIWLSLVAIMALLVWAYFAPVDEIVRGSGKVVPSQQLQVVQSMDGGVVQEILARPGMLVEEGQVLVRIDPTRYSSSLGENRAEFLSLEAKAARLQALAAGQPFELPESVLLEAPQIAEMERRIWATRQDELDAIIKQADDQLRQREEELRETQANRDQAATSCGLTSRELQVTRPLLKSGAVSEVDILRLQRDVARYCGEQKAADAQIERLKAAIEEARSKRVEAELNVRNDAAAQLADTRARLATLRETQVALADRVKLAEVRSPVRGTIRTLNTNTVGGVVKPGDAVLDIVPADDTLLLETRVNPRDIGFLHPGQNAEVKFTAYDFTIYGGLSGHVEQIGSDTITDEQGESYYVVKVRTETAELGSGMPVIPGMQADVHILTGKRTIMQFLLKPVLRARSYAFTER
jgi:adhesin transport system membrane fusion protein